MVIPLLSSEELSIETVKYALLNGNKILKLYEDIIDSYVLDYYVCSHWNKLPTSWRSFFASTLPADLEVLLDFTKLSLHRVMPLEIQCLRVLVKYLAIPRDDIGNISKLAGPKTGSNLDRTNKIEKLLWKQVKKKKQHEVKAFAQLIYETAKDCDCQYLVDVGSGLGHLDRLLAYGYGLKVCGIESNEMLTVHARQLDCAFEKQVPSYDSSFLISKDAPVHINQLISSNTDNVEFCKLVETVFGKEVPFGIVGLHPCGDLGPKLLRLYKTCPNVKFITIVGCCYMKLTTAKEGSPNVCGYPISTFAIQNQFQLSYNAREVACHAIESFVEKLKSNQDWLLKIHSFRAALEYLIAEERPELKHSAIANVKYRLGMSFSEYCSKALASVDLTLSAEAANSKVVKEFLQDWRSVVTFYSIRLLFAPLIESTILLDRYLYLREANNGDSRLITAFDPLLSPRNHVLLGMQRDM